MAGISGTAVRVIYPAGAARNVKIMKSLNKNSVSVKINKIV